MKKIFASLVAFGISFLCIFLVYYLTLPAINLRSIGFYSFILFAASILLLVHGVTNSIFSHNDEKNAISKYTALGLACVVILLLVTLIVFGIISGKMFNSSKYQSVALIDTANFEDDFSDISTDSSNLAIVDLATARKLGDRTIGNIEHASWFEVDDEYNLIIYNGEQYRISPLNYGDFFKANKAKTLPGYVLVNSITEEAKFIKLNTGMRYSPSAYFSYNLTRHLRSQYKSYIFGDSFFEIDEDGTPYWITAVKNPTVGIWGCSVEKSVVITNAIDGTSTEYSIDDIPAWVDHAFALDYLMNIAHDHYEYINGYFNFSKTGVFRTSYFHSDEEFAGYNSFVNSKGEVCFYVGLTPANSAETNVGFLLVNTRNGKFKQYDCAGAEEASAQGAAEGLVQNLGYSATFPTVVNVRGEETYLIALKDKAGLVQRFALCNIENYSIVVEADSINKAIELYLEKLGIDSTLKKVDEEIAIKTARISEIYTGIVDGNSYFYFTFENDNNLYKSCITVNEKQVLLKKGEMVKIGYAVNQDGINEIMSIEF